MSVARLAVAILAIVAVSACKTGPDKGGVVASLVPVATPCAVSAGAAPAFADNAAAFAALPQDDSGVYARAKLYAAGRQQRIEYEARLEAAVAGCVAK